MTETHVIKPANRDLVVNATMAQILRTMLEKPKADHYAGGLAELLGKTPGHTSHELRKLHAAGWASRRESLADSDGPRPRKFYRLTTDGLKLARAEIKTWEFTDE